MEFQNSFYLPKIHFNSFDNGCELIFHSLQAIPLNSQLTM